MNFIQPKNYRWFVIIPFFLMMLLPSVMPSETLGNIAVIVMGAIAILFEILSFRTAENRKETIQNAILLFLTITLLAVSFIY